MAHPIDPSAYLWLDVPSPRSPWPWNAMLGSLLEKWSTCKSTQKIFHLLSSSCGCKISFEVRWFLLIRSSRPLWVNARTSWSHWNVEHGLVFFDAMAIIIVSPRHQHKLEFPLPSLIQRIRTIQIESSSISLVRRQKQQKNEKRRLICWQCRKVGECESIQMLGDILLRHDIS